LNGRQKIFLISLIKEKRYDKTKGKKTSVYGDYSPVIT
jgi:hypothetical protein